MAERIIANLTLDTYQRNKIPPLVIPQHDYGARYIRVRITEQGENVSVASGSVVSIIAKRMADRQSAAFSGSVNADGSVLVPVTQWMLDAPSDDVDCHVAVTGTGYQYSTTSFVISPQERENPSYLEEDDPRVNIVEEALIKVVEEADRAEEQANLAASNAKAEVEKLVGELGVVQETGVSITSVMAQGASSRSFANAIKGEESGGAVLCEDVSPVLHPVVVGVRSKNLIKDANSQTETHRGVTITPNGDGTFTLDGTATGDVFYFVASVNYKAGVEYTLSGCPKDGSHTSYMIYDDNHFIYDYGEGAKVQFSDSTYGRIYIRIAPGATIQNLVFKPMLETGTTVGAFTPCIPNGTAVKVTSAGANMAQPMKDIMSYGCSMSVANDGKITLTTTEAYPTQFAKVTRIYLKAGVSYAISFHSPIGIQYGFIWYAGTTQTPFDVIYAEKVVTPTKDDYYELGVYLPSNSPVGTVGSLYVMINEGPALPYEPFKAGQSIDTTVGSTIDLPSIAPYMSVYTNTEGTTVDVTYVKDTNAVVQKLVNAIVALGGNV